MFCPAVSLNKFTQEHLRTWTWTSLHTPILGEQKITPINLFVQSLGTLICIFWRCLEKVSTPPPKKNGEKNTKHLLTLNMVLNLMAKLADIRNPTKKQQIHRICQTIMNVPGVPPSGLNSRKIIHHSSSQQLVFGRWLHLLPKYNF